MYERALEETESVPLVLIMTHYRQARWRLLKPFSRQPRMALGVRTLLIRHITRSLLTLERQYHVREALGELSPEQDRDRASCVAYRSSLPPQRFILTVIFFAVPAIVITSALSRLTGKLLNVRLRDSVEEISRGVIALVTGGSGAELPQDIGDAIDLGARGLLLLLSIIFAAGYLATRPFVSSFRLKRQILCLAHQDTIKVRDTASSWYVNKSVGCYEQERAVFRALDRKPVVERPADLVILAFPMVCLFLLAFLFGWVQWNNGEVYVLFTGQYGWRESLIQMLVDLSFVLWLTGLASLRLSWLWSVKRDRESPPKNPSPPLTAVADHAYVEARPLSEAAAWPLVTGFFLWCLFPPLSAFFFHRLALTGTRLHAEAAAPGKRHRRGHPVVMTLAFASIIATPIPLCLLLWQSASLLGPGADHRRYRTLAATACPALFVLPVAWFYFYCYSDQAIWEIELGFLLGVALMVLYTLLIAAVQRCQNCLVLRLGSPVPYGLREPVG
ncbi:hypothetical protein ABZW30_25560 [Kitasatospora sp. NPDC004669]|uniref:hypothetical protein n=1 Tax=Kitasatospora sp. NPDC004669 TaxID=3154555 RepID=UPI0033BEC6A7